MAFEYVYPEQQLPGLQYPQYQQPGQQQGSPQISSGAMGGISKLFGGGSGAAGTAGGTSSAPVSAGVAGGGSVGVGAGGGASAGGAGGASGASAGGSAVASAGPWAALAAIIVANEYSAVEGGYRKEDKRKYAKDVLDAEVFHQDIEKRWLPGLGIDEDSKTSKRISVMATPINPLNPKESFKRIKGMF